MKTARLGVLFLLLVGVVTQGMASVTLVEDRLDLDALLWANVSWMMSSKAGFGSPGFRFYRRGAFIGLTGRITSFASMRIYFDAGNWWENPAIDIYADFEWPTGIGLRVGQFKCPVGFEALTEPSDLKMIEYSVVKSLWKPRNPRDVGAMISYSHSYVDASVAIVNGNGRTTSFKDENNSKDAALRVVAKPWQGDGPQFAVRGYYGRWKASSLPYYNGAFEFIVSRGSLLIVSETQYASVQYSESAASEGRVSLYLQSSYDLGLVEPVGRAQFEYFPLDKYALGLTGGVTVRLLNDWLKLAVQYDYFHKESIYPQSAGSEQGLLCQLQAAI